MLEWVIIAPILAAIACVPLRHHPRVLEAVAIGGALISFVALALSVFSSDVAVHPVSALFGILYMDPLSLLFTSATSVVALFVFAYSRGYIRAEVKEGTIKTENLWTYYALCLLFLASMLLATLTSDLLVLWAAVEATTLTSVFLISFYGNKESVEAAWKYLLICSLSITIALVGLLVLGYGMQQAGRPESFAWSDVVAAAHLINPLYLKIAFAFIFVGYGTKVGLVPLHVWLPDAHSQAPTPVSAFLSGVLLNAALYAILRVYPLAAQNPEVASFVSNLFLFFGLLSLGLASLRLYSQENYKRLLAYSSIENMGIIALGVGIGGPLGLMAALFHMVSHSLLKPLAFFYGGIVSLAYGTKEISKIGGISQALFGIGQLFVLINIGIAGCLPFGTFISEIILLAAALSSGNLLVAALLVVFTTIAFGTFLLRSSQMAFGPLSGPAHHYTPDLLTRLSVWGLFALALLGALLAPLIIIHLVNPAVQVILGGS